MSLPTIQAPFVSSDLAVEEAWIDYNGHMNVAYYIVLFDRGLDDAFDAIGIGGDYRAREGKSFFTVESHVSYLRELTLGVVRPSEIGRTVLAEVSVGLINGLVLGVLLGVVAMVWKGNPYLGMVVGGALMLNTIIAVVIGGAVPLLLKRAKVDPAIAAGPILTTVTDMCGFFIVLTFASAMLTRLM